jgi:hypothetical protein
MKFMVMHYYQSDEQENQIPSQEIIEGMGQLMSESAAKGILLAGEGVKLHKNSARLVFENGKAVTVTDGPFAEAKELIGGFALIEVKDKAEAIEFTKRFGGILGDVQVDIRQVVTAEDFGDALTPEQIERENQAREQSARRA